MKKAIKYLSLTVSAFIFGSMISFAGPFDDDLGCPPGCAGSYPNCGPCEDPSIPIDGGVSLIIAAGIGLAGKKTYDLRKKKRNALPDNQ